MLGDSESQGLEGSRDVSFLIALYETNRMLKHEFYHMIVTCQKFQKPILGPRMPLHYGRWDPRGQRVVEITMSLLSFTGAGGF